MNNHGYSGTRIYSIWQGMKQRCLDKSNKDFHSYGGRGISIHEPWLIFKNFLKDMGFPPTNSHQIDRRDNDGNYGPDNCRWVTNKQNSQNTSQSKRWVIDNVTYLSLRDAAVSLGVNRRTVRDWCTGRSYGKYSYKPRYGCYCYLAYPPPEF